MPKLEHNAEDIHITAHPEARNYHYTRQTQYCAPITL